MNRYRRQSSFAAAVALLAAMTTLLPVRARAQTSVQVFVNSSFVAPQAVGSYPLTCGVFSTGALSFRCPMDPGTGPNFGPLRGDISGDPHIQFEANGPQRCNISRL